MKYINPYYPWFTSVGTVKNSGKATGYINADGWGICKVEEDTGTCMKMSFDVILNGWYSGTYLAAMNYRSVNGTSTPNVSLYINNNYYLELRVDDKTVCSTSFRTNGSVWYHIYMEADTVNGRAVVYVDGSKIIDYDGYVKTGAMLDCFKFYLGYSYIKMKNMIATDGELAMDETVVEIDATVESSEWESTDDGYSVSETGKSLVVKPSATSLDGYAITGTALLWESAIGSDNVPAVTAALGNASARIELPRGNSHCAGACFEGISPGDITVTSAE